MTVTLNVAANGLTVAVEALGMTPRLTYRITLLTADIELAKGVTDIWGNLITEFIPPPVRSGTYTLVAMTFNDQGMVDRATAKYSWA